MRASFAMRTMQGPNYFMGHSLKQHKSIDEQIQILKRKGIIIKDEAFASSFLSVVNYYRLSGYLYISDIRNSRSKTFEEMADIYRFDCKLNRILLYALEDVEEALKTRISYTLSSAFPEDPLIYLNPEIYRNIDSLNQFKELFEKAKKANSGVPFIKHHYLKYSGNLPIWVASEIFTMGNVYKIYENLHGKYQKQIARLYNTGTRQLLSWIQNITYTRNHLAHCMRLYGYNFGRIPTQCSNHHAFTQNGFAFDQILLTGYMFSNKAEWQNYIVSEIRKLINEYHNSIDVKDLGFPEDWYTILTTA